MWKYVENTTDHDTIYPGDLFYYDGNRIVEHHKHEAVPGGPPGGGGTHKIVVQQSRDGNGAVKTDANSDATSAILTSSGSDKEAAIHVDNIYEKQKGEILDGLDGGSIDKDSQTNYSGWPPDPPPEGEEVEQVLDREFVYGLDYIDEHVYQYNADGVRQYVFQDANYNVVGMTTNSGSLLRQLDYHPYGRRLATDNGIGTAVSSPISPFGFQGLWHDGETGLVHARHRYLDPFTGRMIGRDPNGSGLLVSTALAMNAQTQMAVISLYLDSQYADGMNPYGFVRSNPITGLDPSGANTWQFDYFDAADRIVSDIVGERTAHLTELNTWLTKSVNVASSLGYMAFSMLPAGDAVILAGKLASGKVVTFQDFFAAGLSIGGAAIVGKMIGKLSFAQKARRAGRVARSASNVPRSLLKGPKNTSVYLGFRNGKPVYVGISNNIPQRVRQHGMRFDKLRRVTKEPLTRRQARSIEQVLHEANPQFENINNPISPAIPWYDDAVEWAEAWLRENDSF